MPTGYTAPVGDGTITTLKEFALLCARAFGATITMRDDPIDAPIPDEFEPSNFHLEKIDEARAELARVAQLKDNEVEQEAERTWAAREAELDRQDAEKEAQRQRYLRMIDQINQWQYPASHREFHKFMVDQLKQSIDFDCADIRPWQPNPKLSGTEWQQERLTKLAKDLVYHNAEYAKEVERVRQRNEWVRALRESLK